MQGDPSIFPMSLGPDVCCTGPLTRKDLSPDRAKLATVVNKTTYKCLNREKPLLFADSRGRDGLGPHHAEHTPSSPI